MAAVALAPTAPREAVIGEVNALVAASAGSVSGAAALRIVRGCVSSGGAVTSGEGFTSALGATGVYTVTFTTAFAVAPAVVATPASSGIALSAIPAVDSFVATAVASDLLSGANTGFSFIAIGAAA